jgi:putative hemolysin
MLKLRIGLLALVLVLGACGDDDEEPEEMANPASVHCVEQGGTLDIRTDEAGGQYGICVFADGSECDEWEFYRGECAPGGGAEIANPASVYCVEQGGTLDLESGMCTFADGSQCEEWAFFRGECSPGESPGGETGIANPASVYCSQEGGTVEIRTDEAGGQYGVCVFADGSECDEWAFFRGECAPGG